MQPSQQSSPEIEQRVVDALRTLGVGAALEHEDTISVDLANGCFLMCGTVNEYWTCDICAANGNPVDCATLTVRSDDERNPAQIAQEIQALVKRLNNAGADIKYADRSDVMQLIHDLTDHLREARRESVTEHKLAMLDGGIAQELIERGEAMLKLRSK